MGIEIERKFLVRDASWRSGVQPVVCRQGYICLGSEPTVRVRIMGEKAYLTVKGGGSGIVRSEFEYEIPHGEAEEMLARICRKPLIEKMRHVVTHGETVWEIDEFCGENSGLVVAEVELQDENQKISLPPWAGREVTGDPRFFNVALVLHPFTRWTEEEQQVKK